jgi:plasmid stabilization system protein ParE
MSLRIEWTPTAQQSLIDVFEYTYGEFGEYQLRKLRLKILKTARRIAAFPTMGTVEPYSVKAKVEYRSMMVIPEIRIIYCVMDNFIQIEYVKNARLDDETMLRNMKNTI